MSMGAELYFQVELSYAAPLRPSRWWHFARLRLSQDYLLFALLAGVRTEVLPDSELECLAPKGLPDNVTEASLAEDSLTVDDGAAELEIPDTCSRADAEEWVRTGMSRYLHNGYSVTHPDFHSHSWASLEELQLVCRRYEGAGGKDSVVVRSVLTMLESLQSAGLVSRAVFWFSG
jgi:hypothetical protein